MVLVKEQCRRDIRKFSFSEITINLNGTYYLLMVWVRMVLPALYYQSIWRSVDLFQSQQSESWTLEHHGLDTANA